MKKSILFLAAVLICVGTSAAQTLGAGETAIFNRGGIRIIDRIDGISTTRQVLITANNGEILLRDIWMINFVDEGWNFPEERKQLETNNLTVFMKNGAVLMPGRIVHFSAQKQRDFEFESGETIPIGQIRRFYFSRTLPGNLAAKIEKAEPAPTPQPDIPSFIGDYERLEPEPPIRLLLRADGTARMEVPRFPKGPEATRKLIRIINGTWEATGIDQVTARFEQINAERWVYVYIFNRESGILVATGEALETLGDLRLSRK